jgi:hypothetical protein
MALSVTKTIEKFAKEGLKKQATRYLKKHPESVEHLTFEELREQVVMHPDAQPRGVSLR